MENFSDSVWERKWNVLSEEEEILTWAVQKWFVVLLKTMCEAAQREDLEGKILDREAEEE